MPRKTIADHAVEAMKEEGQRTIMFGDGILVEIAVRAGLKAEHVLDRMTAALDGIARDTTRFRRLRVRAMDSRGRERIVRGFELVVQQQDETTEYPLGYMQGRGAA